MPRVDRPKAFPHVSRPRMKRHIRVRALLVKCSGLLLLFGCAAVNLFGQASSVPVSIHVETTTREVGVGSKLVLRISLKNPSNEAVPAREDVRILIESQPLGLDRTVLVPKGQRFVEVELVPHKPGIAKILVTSPNLSAGSHLLVVKPQKKSELIRPETYLIRRAEEARRTSRAPAAVEDSERMRSERVTAELPPPPPPAEPAVSETTIPQARQIALEIDPEHPYPENGVWAADVVVVALDESEKPAILHKELNVRLGARLGQLSVSRAVILPGQASNVDQPVKLTSQVSGTDRVEARSELGRVEAEVDYRQPLPSQLRVEANPHAVVNDGRTLVNITVLLLDPANRPTSYADRDLEVILSSSLGELEPRTVTIPSGRFSAEAKLTSSTHGDARVSAKALGLPEGSTTVLFLFPYLMVILSAAGGVFGGFARTARASFSASWFPNLWRNLAIGAIFGLIFYGLALFGAVTIIPKTEISIELPKIPTVNELGAFIFGFIGGFYGRRFWRA